MKNQGFLMAMGCMFAAGLLVVCSASAAVIAESGFNNSSGIADPEPLVTGDLNGQGGIGLGWAQPWVKYKPTLFAHGTATVENTMIYEGDQAVVASGGDATANRSAYGRAFTPQTPAVCDAEVIVDLAVQYVYLDDTTVYVTDCDGGDVNNHVAAAGMLMIREAGGCIRQYDGSISDYVDTKWGTGTIVVDTWYQLRMVFDMDANEYWLGLKEPAETNYDYDIPRQIAQTITKMSGLFFLTESWSVYFDEFRVSTVADVPGDADGDGDVDADDAAEVADHWGAGPGAVWADGDFDGDGWVGPKDASILAAHWTGPGTEANPVPEPSTLALLFGLSLMLLSRRRS